MPREMGDRRSFTVIASSIGETGGRYLSMTPQSAARKAAKKLFDKSPTSTTTIVLRIMETTRRGSSRGKTFTYEATKKTVDETRVIDGKTLNITKKIFVYAADEAKLSERWNKAGSS